MTLPTSAYETIDRAFGSESSLGMAQRLLGNRRRRRLTFTPSGPSALGFADSSQDDPNLLHPFRDDAGAAQRQAETVRRIQRALQQPNLTPEERSELEQLGQEAAKATVFGERGRGGALGTLGRVFELAFRPGRAAILGIQDLLLDRHSVGSAVGLVPKDRPEIELSDYGSVLTGDTERLKERLGSLAGDEGLVSTSVLLSNLGWKPGSSAFNRVARFVAAVGGDIVADPLTFLSFGGAALGKLNRFNKTTEAINEVTRDVIEREIAEQALEGFGRGAARQSVESLADTPFGRKFHGLVQERLPAMVDDAVRAVGPDDVIFGPLNRQIVEEAAQEVKEELWEATVGASMRREFGKIDPTFAQLRRVRARGAEPGLFSKKVLPGYVTGGIRVGSPFGRRGFTIPGTPGVGRQLTEATTRPAWDALKRLGDGRVGEVVERWGNRLRSLGSDHRIVKLIEEVGASAEPLLQVSKNLRVVFREIGDRLNHSTHEFLRVAAEAGDDYERLTREVFALIESGGAGIGPDEFTKLLETGGTERFLGSNPDVITAALEWAQDLEATANRLFTWYREFNPHIGEIERYAPHVPSREGRKLLERLRDVDLRSVSGDRSMELLENVVASQRLRTEAAEVGATAHARHRNVARGIVNVIPDGDEQGALLIAWDAAGMGPKGTRYGFGLAERINQELRQAIVQIDARHPELGLKRFLEEEGFGIFETNAAVAYFSYVNSMQDAVSVYALADAASNLGLVRRATLHDGVEVSIPATVANVFQNWWWAAPAKGESIAEVVGQTLLGKGARGIQRTIRIGDGTATVPAVVANNPRFRDLKREIDASLKTTRSEARRYAAEARRMRQRLIKEGWSPELAEAWARGAHEEILSQARELVRVGDETVAKLQQTYAETQARLGNQVGAATRAEFGQRVAEQFSQVQAAVRQARDDILSAYEGMVLPHREEAAGQIVKILDERDLTMLDASLRQAAVKRVNEEIAALDDTIAELQARMRASGRAEADPEGRLTDLGAELDYLTRERDIRQAVKNPDFAASYRAYVDAGIAIEERYARQAARAVLEDIEFDELLPLVNGEIAWPSMEIGGRKLTAREVRDSVQEAFDAVNSFDAAFFQHPAVVAVLARQVRKGHAALTYEELMRPVVSRFDPESALPGAARYAGPVEEARPWEIDPLVERDFVESLARQRSEYEALVARSAAKGGRQPDFKPAVGGRRVPLARGKTTTVFGEEFVDFSDDALEAADALVRRYRNAAAIQRYRILQSYFDMSLAIDDAAFSNMRPIADPFAAIRRGEWDAAGSKIADTDPKVWAHHTERLHEVGLSVNLELRPYHDAKSGRTTLAMVERGSTADTVARGIPFDEIAAARRAGITPPSVAGRVTLNDPDPEIAAVAASYMRQHGLEPSVAAPISGVDRVTSQRVADLYEQLPTHDPRALEAYEAMARETVEQYQAAVEAGYRVERWRRSGQPYRNSDEMLRDLRENKHLYIVLTEDGIGHEAATAALRAGKPETGPQNPLYRRTGIIVDGDDMLINDLFRAVYDLFGHGQIGNQFGPIGEEMAWMSHARMYTEKARRAVTTETRGQNSWVNYGPHMRGKGGRLLEPGDEGYLALKHRPSAQPKMALLPDEFTFPGGQGHGARLRRVADHPDVAGLADSWIAIEDAFETYRAAKRSVLRASTQTVKDIASFEEAMNVVRPALERALRGGSLTNRRALRDVLFETSKKGRTVLTAEGRTLQRLLPDEEWLRLRNNAEYLTVLGQMDSRTPSTVRDAVRHAKEFQDLAARHYSPETAIEALRRVEGQLDAETGDAVELLSELVDIVHGLRRFGTTEAEADLPLGPTLFGRGGEAEQVTAELGRAREIVRDLRGRRIGEKTVFTKGQAEQAFEALKPVHTVSGPVGAPGEKWIALATRGLDSGPFERSFMLEATAEWFDSWIDATKGLHRAGGLANLRETASRVETWWKAANTIQNVIPFNTRNLIGAIWNNQIGGLNPLDPVYALVGLNAILFRRALRRLGDTEAAIATLPEKIQPHFRAAHQEGAVLETFAANELAELTHGLAPLRSVKGLRQAINPFSPGFALNRAGGRAMESVEDFVRMTLFVKHFDPTRPATARTAAQIVRTVHFDYSDLTNLERAVKRWIPFWVWAKRNFELQLRVLVERPELILRYYKVQRALADNFGGSGDERYDGFGVSEWWGPYAAPTGAFLRKDSPYWARLFVDLDLPVNDLLDFPLFNEDGISLNSLTTWLGNALGPKVDIATALFRDDGYDSVATFGLAQAWQLAEMLPFVEDTTSQQGQTDVPPRINAVFDSFFPWIRNIVEPLTVPSDPRRAQALGFEPGDTSGGARLRALGLQQSRGFGIKMQTPFDQNAASFRTEETIRDMLDRLRRRGEYRDPRALQAAARAFGP